MIKTCGLKLTSTWFSDWKFLISVFGWLSDPQKTQFFDTWRSLNHLKDKWKKIIQLGKKSLTSMPFHYIAPSPSTALTSRLWALHFPSQDAVGCRTNTLLQCIIVHILFYRLKSAYYWSLRYLINNSDHHTLFENRSQ